MRMDDEESDDLDEFDADDFYDGPSKSQVKRDMLALQQLGERLMAMGPKDWTQFPLTPELLDGLDESRRIKGHNALRRHVRRLGKLLRSADAEAIQAIFTQMDQRHVEENRRFQQMDRWRERLVEEGDAALEAFLEVQPLADRSHLRQLIRQAQKERLEERPQAASRKIFKYLRDLGLD